MSHARIWSNRISYLTYLFWVDQGKDCSLASSMETMLSGLLHKTVSCNISGVISSYSQCTTIPQLLAGYFDFLLQDLVIYVKDDIDILREGLIFLLSYIIDSPEDDTEDGGKVRAQIYALINEFPSLIYSIRGEMRGGTCKAMLYDLLLKIDIVKVEVTNLYLMNPYASSQLNSPNTGAIRFLNSVIRNLKSMFEGEVNLIPSLKNLCELLVMELVSLRPVVYNVTEVLQEYECEKIQDLQREIMNMVYNADYFIKFCPARSFSVWYGIIALPNVIELVNNVKTEIENIGADKIYKRKLEESWDLPSSRGTTSKTNRDFTGFREVGRVIIDELTRGQKCLTIISISGSAGQGKTTLAKKIYNDRNIMYHFHKTVWCYVSKDCPTRDLLVQMICEDDKGVDGKGLEMHDLIDHVRKILKGRRYLIILDDIWDVDAWHQLEWSFQDDSNGSRLLFTTRNHDLASLAKSNSISHRLPLFSTQESWELMKKMIFHSKVWPEEFVAIGNRIASYCQGLPLAAALISGVLGRTDQKLETWDEVAENLKSHLARENVIELGYKYLPNHLKSCFLYFGAFPRGGSIRAKKLKLLRIAEGFVDQSSEDLASDYLKDLVSQNLFVVTGRSSMDGIKWCSVHDLLYDLCLEKAKEDNFLNWAEESLVVDQCSNCSSLHRLRIGTSTDPFIKSRPIVSNKKLPTGPLHSLIWPGRSKPIESSYCFLESVKFLTILDIDIYVWTGIVVELGNFPEVILTLMHLRYLALRLKGSIRKIPPAIAKLRTLETLILHFYTQRSIPWPVLMWKMKRLRHVVVSNQRVDLSGNRDFSVAHNTIEKLGSVHLEVYDSRTAEFLQNLPKLKKLECSFSGSIFELFSMVASLTNLESLKIVRFQGFQDIQGLPSFKKNPFINYTKIGSVRKLCLWGLRAPWSVLSEIGKQLPNLEVLKLTSRSFVGCIWKLEDGDFSKLRCLKLSHLDIEEMDISNCDNHLPFSCLEQLWLQGCRRLKEIPSIFGEISSLNTIVVFLLCGILEKE